jgi:hypothetical protein
MTEEEIQTIVLGMFKEVMHQLECRMADENSATTDCLMLYGKMSSLMRLAYRCQWKNVIDEMAKVSFPMPKMEHD